MEQTLRLIGQGPGWVAIDKPAGLASIPERDLSTPCVQRLLERQLGARLWVVHRLDKDVSGVIVYARDTGTHRALCQLFERRQTAKTYLGVTHGLPDPPDGQIDLPLREFGSGRIGVDRARGKPSVTRYRVASAASNHALLEIEPVTGRRHQIRAHLYAIGHPLLGDPLYGSPAARVAGEPLMLHARRLSFTLAGQPATVLQTEPPGEFIARWRACGGTWPTSG